MRIQNSENEDLKKALMGATGAWIRQNEENDQYPEGQEDEMKFS